MDDKRCSTSLASDVMACKLLQTRCAICGEGGSTYKLEAKLRDCSSLASLTPCLGVWWAYTPRSLPCRTERLVRGT